MTRRGEEVLERGLDQYKQGKKTRKIKIARIGEVQRWNDFRQQK